MSSYRRKSLRMTGRLLPLVLGCSILATVAAAAPANHLIISEMVVKTRPPVTTFGSPFIEIVNPTATDADMSDVYITDATTAPSTFYYKITLRDLANAHPGGGNGGDFHAKFPDGYTLAAGDTLVIAITGSTEYEQAYGRAPDFELFEDALTPDLVPELEAAFTASINAGLGGGGNVPVLSDQSESLVLYTWDGSDELVQDLDYILWGPNTSVRFDKSDTTVGSSTYLADTPVGNQQIVANSGPTFQQAFRRFSADEGTETTANGNGATGHDETSENLATTWAVLSGHEPPTVGPVFPAAPIFTEVTASPAAPYDGLEVSVTATVVTGGTLTGSDLVYSIDGGAEQTVAMTDQGGGSWRGVIPAQVEGVVVRWRVEADNSGGGAATYPPNAPHFDTSYTVDAAPEPGDYPDKLLITEVCTGFSAREFVEIANPNAYDVMLDDYYLADSIHTGFNQLYWRITEGNPSQPTVGGGDFFDFHARFPAGFKLAAGDTIVIAVAGSDNFFDNFGFSPDIELFELGTFPNQVPDMRWVFGDANSNSISGPTDPTLTDNNEVVVLYHWDGEADFVTDIDMFHWRLPASTSTSFVYSKSGVVSGTHTYLPETSVNDQLAKIFNLPHENTESYIRTDASEGTQTPSGSNGVLGRDENSEDFLNTFAVGTSEPSQPSGNSGIGGGSSGPSGGDIDLVVPARTFLPEIGESFPIQFISRSNSETKLRIFDLEGRLVRSLFDNRRNGPPPTSLPPDPTQPHLTWDGRNDQFELVRGGMYVLHLSVVDMDTGNEDTITKPVVVATRLSR